jgi:hypothetical protein
VSVILVRLEFARLIFEDDSNIKIRDNPFIGSRMLFDEDRLTDGTGRDGTERNGTGRDGTGRDGTGRDGTDGQTDRHEEANGHFPQIFNAPKTLCSLSERFFFTANIAGKSSDHFAGV